jgi:hypothetical protein
LDILWAFFGEQAIFISAGKEGVGWATRLKRSAVGPKWVWRLMETDA